MADKHLSEVPKIQRPLWDFLNSSLGLWFLSTIVIGLFTFSYNEYSQYKKDKIERQTAIKHLDIEIESRISQFWVHLAPLVNQKDTAYSLKKGISPDTIRVLWAAFKNPPSFNPKLMATIYKEYENRPTLSLMIELSALLRDEYDIPIRPDLSDDPDHLKPIETVSVKNTPKIKIIRQIEKAAVFVGGDGIFYDTDLPSVKAIWASFRDNVIVGRWNMLFPYTDCLFC